MKSIIFLVWNGFLGMLWVFEKLIFETFIVCMLFMGIAFIITELERRGKKS